MPLVLRARKSRRRTTHAPTTHGAPVVDPHRGPGSEELDALLWIPAMSVAQVANRGKRSVGETQLQGSNVVDRTIRASRLDLDTRDRSAHEESREVDEMHRLADNASPALV